MSHTLQEKRLSLLLRHIRNVQEDTVLLGEKLIEQGKEHLGISLISNGMKHDSSKFRGIEWQYLHGDVKDSDPEKFLLAAKQHVTNNAHHPEYWPGGVDDMAPIFLSEMVCDWHARSSEFGNDLMEWIKTVATDKFGFSTSGRVYKDIKHFVDLLLEKKFA